MTTPAVACGSTPTLAQVSVGQARWSPPPTVLVPGRVDELAGEHYPVGVEREPDHQRAQPRPDHLDGLAEPTRTSSGPSMPMVTSLATSAILPG